MTIFIKGDDVGNNYDEYSSLADNHDDCSDADDDCDDKGDDYGGVDDDVGRGDGGDVGEHLRMSNLISNIRSLIKFERDPYLQA